MIENWVASIESLRNTAFKPSASSAAIQAQVASSLGAPVSSRTIRRPWLKDIWYCGTHQACYQSHPPTTPAFGVVPRTMGLDCNGMEPGRLQRRI
ncbi:hypothetical protein TNCV_2013961 [Trichonephila clavipes]|nr:hypothetical protein TNCV_2013961 [Trichonephila clavipes]